MKKLVLCLCVVLLFCAIAMGDRRGLVQGTTDRVDVDTNGRWLTEDSATWNNLLLRQNYSADNDTNYWDVSSGANDGVQATVSAQPAWSNANGGFLQFDGIGDYIQGGTPPYVPSKFDSLTIAGWIRPSSTTGYHYAYLSGDTTGAEVGKSRLEYSIRNTAAGGGNFYMMQYVFSAEAGVLQLFGDSTPIELGEWQHIAVALGNAGDADTSTRFYYNGSSVPVFTNSDSANATLAYSNDYVIGAENVGAVGGFLPGALDDVRIYSANLTAAQIGNTYSNTLLTYWPAWDLTDPQYAATVLSYPFSSNPPTTNFWVQDYSHENPDASLQGGNVGSQITANSQPAWSNANGGFLQFDGVDDQIIADDAASLDISTHQTVAAWVKPVNTNSGYFVSKWKATGNQRSWIFYATGDKLRYLVSNDGSSDVGQRMWSTASSTTFVSNQWHYITGVYDGTGPTFDLYLNGSQLACTTNGSETSIFGGSANVGIGGDDDAANFVSSSIDDVRIYSTNLTAAQITNIFDNTKATYGL